MKKFLNLTIAAVAALMLTSAAVTPQEQYVAKYAESAVREMYRSGVPASITLAQGLLESRYGLSVLATEGNNHFGIKCHDWKGRTMRHDDDAKAECFRVYDSAEESFQDHSDFLRYRDRYKFLFDLKTTDYKGWAYGLKKAGYATDPAYPTKLIKLIEDYDLSRYDKMDLDDVKVAKAEKPSAKDKKSSKKAAKNHIAEEDVIPQSPHQLEQPKRAEESGEVFTFPLNRTVYMQNGVPFVYSIDGETYQSLALSNKLFLKEILKFNDLASAEKLLPGTVVYLQPKKSKGVKGLDKHIVDAEGETLRDIAQRYAVTVKSLKKLNALGDEAQLHEGQTLKLR